jgi:hypothetical protein
MISTNAAKATNGEGGIPYLLLFFRSNPTSIAVK